MIREYKTILKIRKIVPSFIWRFFFIDIWNGGSKYNSLASPPSYGGFNVKWKNIGLLILILWLILITIKVI